MTFFYAALMLWSMKKPKPKQPKKIKTAHIGISTTDDVKQRATDAAKAEGRSLSNWLEMLIIRNTKEPK